MACPRNGELQQKGEERRVSGRQAGLHVWKCRADGLGENSGCKKRAPTRSDVARSQEGKKFVSYVQADYSVLFCSSLSHEQACWRQDAA